MIFDNCTGHSYLPCDALPTGGDNPLNATPGGVNNTKMRSGAYVDKNGNEVRQTCHFGVGDILHINIKKGTNTGVNMIVNDITLADGKVRRRRSCTTTAIDYNKGSIIEVGSKLVEMSKGMDQYLSERNIVYDEGQCKQKAYVGSENMKGRKAREMHAVDRSSAAARIVMLEVMPKNVVIYEYHVHVAAAL